MIRSAMLDEIPGYRGPLRERARKRRPEQRRALWIGGGSISIPGDPRSSAAGFNGQFASLFPGAYQVLQSDLGLTYGGTPLATGTTPPVGTLSGSLATVPVPLWFKCTTAGPIGGAARFAAYADGLGVTPFQTNIAPAAGVPVALAAPCVGLSHAWAAGTAALDNVWKATCAGWADQTANGLNASNVVPATQPVITIGLNGKPGLLFDGINDVLRHAMIASGTNPLQMIVIGRLLNNASANQCFIGDAFDGTGAILCLGSGGNVIRMFNGVHANPVTPASLLVPIRISATFTGSIADEMRAGSVSATGTSAGALHSIQQPGIGTDEAFSLYANAEIFCVIRTPPVASLAAFDSALNSAAGYGPGAIAV